MEKNEKFGTYHDFLKNEIMQFRGPIEDYIYYLPSLFKLLTDVLDSDKLSGDDRKSILCTLGYFVTPNDVIPEDIYGPAGYVDDIFLCAYVLKDIMEKYGTGLLENCWDTENDPVEEVIDYCLEKTSESLKEKKAEIFQFVGIQNSQK